MVAPSEPREEVSPPTSTDALPTQRALPARLLFEDLFRRSLLLREEWDVLPVPSQEYIRQQPDSDKLLDALVEHKLLTEFQAGRIRTGRSNALLLGNYRILDRIGTGGMGIVYKAEHRMLQRTVALKVLPCPVQDDLQGLDRFLAEIRNVASLKHPNIVVALDAGMMAVSDERPDQRCYYFVMEYVPGDNLDKAVRTHGPLPVDRACGLVCQIASALAEAHQHQLIHRDIKPSNILVTPEGEAKLLDFGLARSARDRRLTDPGTVLGSLDYMAPEQAGALGPIDHRADV
jgi:serine/threonine protein kinase